ncbi:hypothetical protein ACDY96_00055 [Rhizobium mongolense]|uniref:hypothetical protein n=1 Tax=Rhizobium mongolense TaxID=57676 RepID=UPI003557CF51
MELENIIAALEAAEGPDRKIDESIALQVGYVLSIVQGNGEPDRKVWWFGSPRTQVRLPTFTASVDRAIHLAELVDPNHIGAMVWEKGQWRAQMNNGAPCFASTAAVAMCLAAMRELYSRSRK